VAGGTLATILSKQDRDELIDVERRPPHSSGRHVCADALLAGMGAPPRRRDDNGGALGPAGYPFPRDLR
jgi:hypothetical protein